MRIALFQPDIAGNVGTIMRLAACFGTPLDIVLPCGFPLSDRSLRRASMDYRDSADITLHADFGAFLTMVKDQRRRSVLLSSHGETRLPDAQFDSRDILLLGSESAGAPPEVHAAAALRVRIPMRPDMRSLNIAVAAGIALGEALRQTGTYPA
jgi:tRNA (cytidine/uridine-2'-O-)-methyltransferase